MTIVHVNPKVEPYDIHVPTPKQDNYLDEGANLVRRINSLIIIQVILGINRIYLLEYNAIVSWLSYIYVSCLFLLTGYAIFLGDGFDKTYVVFKDTSLGEYMILILVSTFSNRNTLKDCFRHISAFDNMLNISKDISDTVQVKTAAFWIVSSFLYCAMEFFIHFVYLCDNSVECSLTMVYVASLAHDTEQILFNTIIQMILLRIRIMKAHIMKSFSTELDAHELKEFNKIEALSNNIQLDTTGMHRAYELLHKCAEQLNSVMGFPMIVMLFSSGMSSTLMLKTFFQLTQENDGSDSMRFNATMAYTIFRCIKFSVLVILPCYYASLTTRQVSYIRTMLHNAVNTLKLDKIERRKTKAFFQLTQDNDFTYALWGVIRLSMSLPLSYASLCTTYLVIIIQFSKFID